MSAETTVRNPRTQWLESTEFHTLTEAQVLREVARRTKEVRAQATTRQAHPLVLLDLDGTLYEVGPRTQAILKEWAAHSSSKMFATARKIMEAVELKHVGYSLKDCFRAAGLDLKEPENLRAWESAKHFWLERFFTSSYLPHDHPYPGAQEFAREIYELGAEIVYLTGRDEPNMGEGTRLNLIRDGFPWNVERTHLLMKPDLDLTDLEHKRAAADYINRHGTLIASFENEPQNIVALQEIFPQAMHVFVETAFSDRVAKPLKGLYRIRGFV